MTFIAPKQGQKIDGLLLIDKPEGCTSHDMVARARRALGMKAIGHGGTLDPMASGLLVLLAGEGTKLADYILKGDKGYRVRVQLGLETDTLDKTGKVLSERQVSVTREDLERVIGELQGELTLEVPIFSAVKVNGQKLYERARRGETIEEPSRKMTFYEVKLLEFGPDWFEAEIKCSKGSFIRSWAREAGRRLGTGGCVSMLRRTWSAPYSVADAVRLDPETGLSGGFVPIDRALPDWPSIVVDGKDRTLLENGQISYRLRARLQPYKPLPGQPGIKVLGQPERSLIALLTYSPRIDDFALERVFPPSSRSAPKD
ncbi:MAG TPA: tRNA pseudouridine(55) synthase TruB [Bdellovibrionales bacterium]|nr:tRNA pseudouridine(55) synthase TruB [Bdellovibrionales bacterium]